MRLPWSASILDAGIAPADALRHRRCCSLPSDPFSYPRGTAEAQGLPSGSRLSLPSPLHLAGTALKVQPRGDISQQQLCCSGVALPAKLMVDAVPGTRSGTSGLMARQCHFTRRAPGSAAESSAAGAVPGGHSGLSALEYDSHVTQAGDAYRVAFRIILLLAFVPRLRDSVPEEARAKELLGVLCRAVTEARRDAGC